MASAPVVAVCTNRSSEAAAEALAALAAQVPAERLAVVTSGLSPGCVGAHRAAAPGPVLEESRPGLSLARNRALEWAPPGGVIAFVDDDAVVGPGWWEALELAWNTAAEDVGCIGGPIHPRYDAPPPGWLSDPILPSLTVLDLGPEELVLDPSSTAVYGANISFAVDALRRIGGFDPRFGHSGSRAFFAEEDQAQRALAAAGYRVLYSPDMRVEHVIPAERLRRGSFIRRRFAYGRALGRRGGRRRSLALRQVVVSGGGSVVALARGDQVKFMERAVRAAENAGVLIG